MPTFWERLSAARFGKPNRKNFLERKFREGLSCSEDLSQSPEEISEKWLKISKPIALPINLNNTMICILISSHYKWKFEFKFIHLELQEVLTLAWARTNSLTAKRIGCWCLFAMCQQRFRSAPRSEHLKYFLESILNKIFFSEWSQLTSVLSLALTIDQGNFELGCVREL